MPIPKVKLTQYRANRQEARPYARLEPTTDSGILTLQFDESDDSDETETSNDNIVDTTPAKLIEREDNIADPELTIARPGPVTIDELRRRVVSPNRPTPQRAQQALVRQPMQQPTNGMHGLQPGQRVPQQRVLGQQIVQSTGIPSAVKWIGGLLAAGLLFVALNGQAGNGAKGKSSGDDEEYFY